MRVKYKLVDIEWIDSASSSRGWYPGIEDVKVWHKEPFIIRTIGFEVVSDKLGVTLASSISQQDSFGNLWFIPRKAILRRRVIKNAR